MDNRSELLKIFNKIDRCLKQHFIFRIPLFRDYHPKAAIRPSQPLPLKFYLACANNSHLIFFYKTELCFLPKALMPD